MSQHNIRWLKDRVLVRPIKPETKSGIVIPDTKHTPEVGVVIETADKVQDLIPGDKVLFPKYVGLKIQFTDEELLVFSAYQIIAVFT